MSKLEELIQELCPNGVEFKRLIELGKFYGGLTGKSKEDFREGNKKFVTYMNVFKNPSLDLNIVDSVKIYSNERQRKLEYGDVLFTGSSESIDECAMSSVITTHLIEDYYLNSFCFVWHPNDISLFNLDFLKHLFRSSELRKQLIKTASGVTRFNVSKKKMEEIFIPIPPLEVQSEIVRILDNFTLLTAELTAELITRKQQYEYYRNILFESLNGRDTILGEICEFVRGPFGGALKKEIFVSDGYAVYEQQNAIYSNTNIRYFITEQKFSKMKRFEVKPNDLIMSCSGTVGRIFVIPKNSPKGIINQALLKLTPKENVDSYFLKYVFDNYLTSIMDDSARGGGLKNVPGVDYLKIVSLKLPSLEEQQKIVKKLDIFKKYCEEISDGLPAEIELRKQQYEYYRDKLLTFKEL